MVSYSEGMKMQEESSTAQKMNNFSLESSHWQKKIKEEMGDLRGLATNCVSCC